MLVHLGAVPINAQPNSLGKPPTLLRPHCKNNSGGSSAALSPLHLCSREEDCAGTGSLLALALPANPLTRLPAASQPDGWAKKHLPGSAALRQRAQTE